ncbi:MAG TPA: DUF1648 domain-containing protein [Saprospiraceae bacterium]|nr:DUF1648 domain-containing protein [Saprospiraceae bacterium]HMP22590.1 DUF1648 domain-containing protein [Saprospiraceae bacterium]
MLNLKAINTNQFLTIITLFILASQFVLIISNFELLPDKIPMHTTAGGEVDQWGPKWTIWLMPGINVLILTAIFYFKSRPEILNYPVKVTEENKTALYSKMQRLLLVIGIAVSIVILLVTLQTISHLHTQANTYTQGIILMIALLSLSPILAILYINATTNARAN